MELTERIIHNCSPVGDVWAYTRQKIGEDLYQMKVFIPNAQVGDLIYMAKQAPLFEIVKIQERRNHAGVFNNPELAKDSYLVIEARQLSKEENQIILNHQQQLKLNQENGN